MPRYFFHVFNDDDTVDEEGAELPDLAVACERARAEVRILAAESVVAHGHLIRDHRIDIECGGEIVASIRFRDAVAVR